MMGQAADSFGFPVQEDAMGKKGQVEADLAAGSTDDRMDKKNGIETSCPIPFRCH